MNEPQVSPYPSVEILIQIVTEATPYSERTVRKILAVYLGERVRLLGERADSLLRREQWEFEVTGVVPGEATRE